MQTTYIILSLMQVNPVHSSSFQVIALNSSSPWGYEMKHAALHKAGDYNSAVDALEVMLSKIAESPDPDVQRELFPYYHDKNDLFTLFDRTR